MQEPMSGLRWARAAGLILLGVVAAWSWLFVVSRWGPAKRVDILTFKAGLTSKVMRTLLKPAQDAGHHHSHDSASISGIYATPEYYTMTEQTREAAKYLPEQFAVFYVFEDIHLGELPLAPPAVSFHVDNEEPVAPMDSTVVRDSYHHRVSVVRFPTRDVEGKPLISQNACVRRSETDDARRSRTGASRRSNPMPGGTMSNRGGRPKTLLTWSLRTPWR